MHSKLYKENWEMIQFSFSCDTGNMISTSRQYLAPQLLLVTTDYVITDAPILSSMTASFSTISIP
jgi:hypothetical protein